MYRTIIRAENLLTESRPDWVLLDCRFSLDDPEFGERAYRGAHLPNAHYLNLDYHLSGNKTGSNGRHPLPDPQRLAVDLGARGVGSRTQVVLYDDGSCLFAARAWWLMRWIGHEAAAVLDGGMPAYLAAGGQLDQHEAPRHTRRLPLRSALAHSVDTSAVLQNLTNQAFVVIDARAPDRFRGAGETLDPAAGHIPDARNRFFRDNLTQQGHFLPADELERQWRDLLGPEHSAAQVVHQCGSGVSACVNLLAMEIAGLAGSRLYPGSWSEWSADPARPVVTG